jgi:hypothetical protein
MGLVLWEIARRCAFSGKETVKWQALKYRLVTNIVRPIREIVRRREETAGHSVRPKWNWGLLFVRPKWISVRPNCNFVQHKSKCTFRTRKYRGSYVKWESVMYQKWTGNV